MKVILEGDTRIRLDMTGDGFEISSAGAAISPYHLLAASLASCTALTVASWAAGAGVGTDRLSIAVEWTFIEGQPKRVQSMSQALHWPELLPARVQAADRAAKLCPIDATLRAGAEVTSRIEQ